MIHVGDCLDVMRTMQENSIDSIVTDPPYGIGFMGKAWDGQAIVARHYQRDSTPEARRRNGLASAAGSYDLSPKGMRAFQKFSAEWGAEALRIAKPGAYCVAFASPRTFHRLVCGLEEAGWDIRDTLMWIFGSGFPKSRNGPWGGTALKPAWEPIILARKPIRGTVAATFAEYGTGGLNIDGCRVAAEPRPPVTGRGAIPARNNSGDRRDAGAVAQPHELGRWPANVIHDGSDEVLAAFPDAPGQMADASTDAEALKTQNAYGAMRRGRAGEATAEADNNGPVGFKMRPGARRIDSGSAARFFYCAKASRADRNDGCEGLPSRPSGMVSNTSGQHITRRDGGAPAPQSNHHPTVKPTDLMRWLCRLVTPAGGLILDPFAGSGSTGRGALLEGFQFTGIELDPEYAAIAEARIRAVQPGLPFGDAA